MFIACYIETENATQSAIKAGYSEKSANRIGWQLLQKEKIKNEIRSIRTRLSKDFPKEKFIEYALNDYALVDVKEPNRARFLELAAKGAGHLGNNEQKSNQTLNITQININGTENKEQLWDLSRKLLGNE